MPLTLRGDNTAPTAAYVHAGEEYDATVTVQQPADRKRPPYQRVMHVSAHIRILFRTAAAVQGFLLWSDDSDGRCYVSILDRFRSSTGEDGPYYPMPMWRADESGTLHEIPVGEWNVSPHVLVYDLQYPTWGTP